MIMDGKTKINLKYANGKNPTQTALIIFIRKILLLQNSMICDKISAVTITAEGRIRYEHCAY